MHIYSHELFFNFFYVKYYNFNFFKKISGWFKPIYITQDPVTWPDQIGYDNYTYRTNSQCLFLNKK